MRPIPVPDGMVRPGYERKVLAGPDGDLTSDDVAPLEVLVSVIEGLPVMTSFWVPETNDYQFDGVVCLTVHGTQHPPLALRMFPPQKKKP